MLVIFIKQKIYLKCRLFCDLFGKKLSVIQSRAQEPKVILLLTKWIQYVSA